MLHDLSSSCFEGSCCPLARRGYSRDGRPGTLQVDYGLLTAARGCPLAVSVFAGNTAESLTFLPAVQRVRERLQRGAGGDGGRAAAVVSQKAIDELRGQGGVDSITALESVSRSAPWSSRVNCSWGCSTSAASIFPNTASCLRLVSALLAECDEEWMTGKIYLNLHA